MTDEILPVSLVSKEDGDYIVRCPHCKKIISIEGEDLSEIQGEQYQHRACNGWLEVTRNAHFVRRIP